MILTLMRYPSPFRGLGGKIKKMKQDISNKDDIEMIVKSFYEKVKSDETIGIFFSEVVPINWETHLPKMCAFWENVLFFTGEYEGNPIVTHRQINQQYATEPIHFQKWMQLFDKTIDALFAGTNAEKMKAHAKSIASVMMQKL